jgi:hypothetical protein
MDMGDFMIDTILSQKEERVKAVTFYSKNRITIEFYYEINNEEMLVIVSAFDE